MKFMTFLGVPAQVRQNLMRLGVTHSVYIPLLQNPPLFRTQMRSVKDLSRLLSAAKVCFHLVFPAWVSVNLFLAGHASSPLITTYVARLWATVGMLYASTNRRTPHGPLSQQAIAPSYIPVKITAARPL